MKCDIVESVVGYNPANQTIHRRKLLYKNVLNHRGNTKHAPASSKPKPGYICFRLGVAARMNSNPSYPKKIPWPTMQIGLKRHSIGSR
jgi:hypothetical protein